MDNYLEYEKSIIKNAYFDQEIFSYIRERVNLHHKEPFFTLKEHQYIFEVYAKIVDENQRISITSVNQIISRQDLRDVFKDIIFSVHQDENQWKSQLLTLINEHNRRILLSISNNINSNISTSNVSELAEEIIPDLYNVVSQNIRQTSFREAYIKTLNTIKEINSGRKDVNILTGDKKFDDVVALSKNRVILIAAQKKIGKTRYMVDLIDKIIENNDNVAIQWYSFEMNSEELIRCFMGRKFEISERELMGKTKKPITSDINIMERSINIFQEYPIEFIDEACTVHSIRGKFLSFVRRNQDKKCICVIDNLGLIVPHMAGDLAFEDDVSRILKGIRDETGATILLLHHLTKESESKWNKEDGYEPKVAHIRGSSRIVDFANQVLLLHRPDHYKDLMEEAKAKGLDNIVKGLFIADVALNRHGDALKIKYKHNIKFCQFKEIQDEED